MVRVLKLRAGYEKGRFGCPKRPSKRELA